MTYFAYKHIRGTRSEGVYAGSTLLGRVAVKANWRSRLLVSPNGVDLYYCAIDPDGDALPGSFLSRHDAAEALYEVARETSRADEGAAIPEA
jgi:hypothetical protein